MTKAPKPDSLYYGRPTLRERGWTDSLIERFLGAPDLLAPNPHYKISPPRKLYLIARVEETEKGEAFVTASLSAAQRKAASARATETKRQAMARHLESVAVFVPTLDRETLIREACRHYNRHQDERAARRAERRGWDEWDNRDRRPATPDSETRFLERITVNYLRHALSGYESELERVYGKVGVAIAYASISRKVFKAISSAYPHLAAECSRQMQARLATSAGTESR